ncbi:helix-turn-helix domain-containing protein [Adhaeribacter pallidiroseus]|uniref:HTH-type transcriptional activator RhaS n=1 Tax=Adhaeribacter pallidiroseus TaxID=2072847 RepID=A0A369QP66_9BACT|nr:helix-turn-helix transcriptional regulator [Adhaeribacter pallidiroseus]RDC66180.1 HTH-type transcriptional activator RhaS [Adhaeribacter pallidiroseus]
MANITSLQDFYREMGFVNDIELKHLLPDGLEKEIGHFNVFNIASLRQKVKETKLMPYNRRIYYKISLIKGHNRAEYADKVIDIRDNALLFASPKVPYNYLPQDEQQAGFFCIFTPEFLAASSTSILLDELPIFKPGGYPIFQLNAGQIKELEYIYEKMFRELASDYAFKYDLLRNYVLELIHFGQKLQPDIATYTLHNATARIAGLFVELLERQFPITSPGQQLELRTAKAYAERLAVHVNHLNKVLKENTGKTTTDVIGSRLVQEAKILLKQTDWNVSEIAYSLGFEEVAHFSNFFKKQAGLSPLAFRS